MSSLIIGDFHIHISMQGGIRCRLVYIKSQELHELAWLLWRRAFFQGAVNFLYTLSVGHFFQYVQDLLRMSEKIDHLVDSHGTQTE